MGLPDFLKGSSSEESAELVRGGPGDGRIVAVSFSTSKVRVPSNYGGFHLYKRANRRSQGGHAAFEYVGREN